MKIERAYSTITIKAVNEEQRTIEGIATTPTPDRMQDIVELDGMEFKLPMPFLYQHDSRKPIGNVTYAKAVDGKMMVKIQVAQAGVAEYIDEAWSVIKAGLVRGLSIGFRSLEQSYDNVTGGFHFIRSEWMELSAVTIPANAEATILAVKSLDTQLRAASGVRAQNVFRLDAINNLPGATGSPRTKTLTIKEQIVQFTNKRALADSRVEEIMGKAATEGRTLDAAEQEEYDTLMLEVKATDAHIVRLKTHEGALAARATAVTAQTVEHNERAGNPRATGIITLESNLPKGTGFTRMVGALVQSKGDVERAAGYAERRWKDSSPEVALVLRSVVDAGDTTTSGWASQLVPAAQQLQNEFLELLRPATILGRIPNLRKVPFNIAVPLQTGDGTYGWTGEGAAAPVGQLTLSSATLAWAKANGIIAITKELALLSSPDAEAIVRNSMIKGCARFLDQQFVGSAAAVANVSPAGSLNGISSTAVSGTTAAAFLLDMNTLLGKFITNNQDPTNLVILMSATTALAVSLMKSSLGTRLYPEISLKQLADGTNGTLLGLPVIVSQNVSSKIIAINADDILMADGNQITVDVSDQASVEMDTVPALGEDSPVSAISTLKSFWQNGLIGLKVERFITWKVARTSAVEYLTAVAYTPS